MTNKYNINIILACDVSYGIGKDNQLLYQFKKDLEHFKNTTSGKSIVMGRKTWDSLPFKLPNRKNIVVSNQSELEGKQPDMISDLDTILEMSINEEIWIIGGSQIYNFFINYAKKIELTRIVAEKESDTNVQFLEEYLLDYNITEIRIDKDVDKKTNKEYQINFIRYEKQENQI